MGPVDKRDERHRYGHHPSKYVDIFKNMGVNKVIRLNEVKYDKNTFTNNGISHNELFFVDGSNPPDHIVEDFLEVVEEHFDNPNN